MSGCADGHKVIIKVGEMNPPDRLRILSHKGFEQSGGIHRARISKEKSTQYISSLRVCLFRVTLCPTTSTCQVWDMDFNFEIKGMGQITLRF